MSPRVLENALRHLRRDERMARLIRAHKKPSFERSRDTFQALCSAIIYQQLSGKAAATIHARFIGLYKGKQHPTPQQVAKTSIEKFRTVGISRQKASYLIDLAQKVIDGTVDEGRFHAMTDDEIREHLVRVKGIGVWTADMFLMFTLKRPDVLPTGDLGIQKGMKKIFGLRTLPTPERMKKLAAPWSPYRTIASWYLWQAIDTVGQFD